MYGENVGSQARGVKRVQCILCMKELEGEKIESRAFDEGWCFVDDLWVCECCAPRVARIVQLGIEPVRKAG